MILLTNYNENTLYKNLKSNIFEYIYIKTDKILDNNIYDNNDKIKIFNTDISDFEIINKYNNYIFILANSNIVFNKLKDNIDINKYENYLFYKIKINDDISYYIIKSPVINQKIIQIENIFECNIKNENENENNIYINGFWNGFIDKTDSNNILFFEKIFLKSKLYNYKITNDLNEANILFESIFSNSLVNYKKWKYKIHYSGEPRVNNYKDYDLVLFSEKDRDNIVDLPLFVYYIYNNNLLEKIINRKKICKIPENFCCFIVSNGNCLIRNKMFNILNSYKKVDSYGKYNNNMNQHLNFNYWTDEYINFISKYKFIICFENSKFGTYITEKIINSYIAKIVPIYWGTHYIKNIFNENSMLFLEEENDISFNNLLNKIIELDNDDNKYLEYVNNKVLKNNYFFDNYTIDIISNKINNIL